VAGTIRRYGTPEQQERWVPGLMSGEIVGSWGLTEPSAGSDAFGSMRTTARPDGDTWVLNGQKTFITNAPCADVFVIYAKLEENGTRSIQPFLVERGTPGLDESKPFRLSQSNQRDGSPRAAAQARLISRHRAWTRPAPYGFSLHLATVALLVSERWQ
jgi:alkylation response protein AidB-like acyl-CoA dehydrogenase